MVSFVALIDTLKTDWKPIEDREFFTVGIFDS
jgi:hypothetical protein